MKVMKALIIGVFLVGMVEVSHASTIIQAQSATYSSTNVSSPLVTWNQKGLEKTYTSGVTDWDDYFGDNPTHFEFSSTVQPKTATVEYDLGTQYEIDRIAFWNYGSSWETKGYAVRELEILLDNQSIGIFSLPAVSGSNIHITADIIFFSKTYAQTIKFQNIITQGTTGIPGYGIGEVAFGTATEPIPEPATIALLGIGLVGLAGAEVRRKWKKKAVDNS